MDDNDPIYHFTLIWVGLVLANDSNLTEDEDK